MQHLSFLNQIFHRPCNIFLGNRQNNAVLRQNIDMVGAQTLQGAFHRPADVVRLAVQGRGLLFLNAKTKLVAILT